MSNLVVCPKAGECRIEFYCQHREEHKEIWRHQVNYCSKQIIDDLHKIIATTPDCSTTVLELGKYIYELQEASK